MHVVKKEFKIHRSPKSKHKKKDKKNENFPKTQPGALQITPNGV